MLCEGLVDRMHQRGFRLRQLPLVVPPARSTSQAAGLDDGSEQRFSVRSPPASRPRRDVAPAARAASCAQHELQAERGGEAVEALAAAGIPERRCGALPLGPGDPLGTRDAPEPEQQRDRHVAKKDQGRSALRPPDPPSAARPPARSGRRRRTSRPRPARRRTSARRAPRIRRGAARSRRRRRVA